MAIREWRRQMTKKADDGAGDDIDQSDGWDRVIEVSAPAMTLINPWFLRNWEEGEGEK